MVNKNWMVKMGDKSVLDRFVVVNQQKLGEILVVHQQDLGLNGT